MVNKYRMRTAAQDDANTLLKAGTLTPQEIADGLDIPLSVVQAEQARIETMEKL
jgi:hypothetical protein